MLLAVEAMKKPRPLPSNVEAGETVATLFASDKNLFAEAAEHLRAALNYSAAAPAQKAVVFDTIE